MATTKLSIDHFARIEGHGNIHVNVEDGVVGLVEMNVTEAARFFEAMVRGRSFNEVSYVASRICGICSASHVVTTLMAIEEAFDIEVSARTSMLRQLLVHGSYLQNHATHLYILAAPDYVGEQSVFPLAQSAPEIFERALRIKQCGNELCTIVGGRSIHPINAVVGGFTGEPSAEELLALADRLDALADDCIQTGELFSSFDAPSFETEGDFLALVKPDDYAILDGNVRALRAGWERSGNEYGTYVQERSVGHSNAKFSTLEDGRTFMTGALARINHSWGDLTQSAKLVAAKAGLRPVCLNSFHNNLCQAIEIVDAAERCARICRALVDTGGSSEVVDFSVREGEGIGVTEAPRGTLYHRLSFDSAGAVVHADILTPTAQSLANLEADIKLLVPTILDRPKEEFVALIEKLVRAYDPCLSCAVH